MSDVRELYQQMIIDHGRHPRHFCVLDSANHVKEGYNPLCGDRLTIYLIEQAGIIENIAFQGAGCAISIASASLMSEVMLGKTIEEADVLFQSFHQLVTVGAAPHLKAQLGKLMVLGGVLEFPARVKCATLAWHTMQAALHDPLTTVSTE